ncbi:hypothetical protein HAX54_024059, partial [Datura stramonium]|nr:hypothetical protein [Datura stramonium]
SCRKRFRKMVKIKAKQWLEPTTHMSIQQIVLSGRGLDSEKVLLVARFNGWERRVVLSKDESS